MSFHHRSSVAAAAAGMALLAPLAHPALAQQQVGMGRSVTATLTAADPVLPPGQSHYRMFSFYGTAGQTVQIYLVSSDFDSHLSLQDPLGQKVAEDEDSGGGRNARIWYTMPTTGMYLILAGARRADERGAFTLSVVATRERPPAPPPAPPPAQPAQPAAPSQPAAQQVAVAPPPAPVDTTPAKPVEAAPQPAAPTQPAAQPVAVAPLPARVDTTPAKPVPAPPVAVTQPAAQPAVTAPPPTRADTTPTPPTQPQPVAPQPAAQPAVIAPPPVRVDTTARRPSRGRPRPPARPAVVTPPPAPVDTTPAKPVESAPHAAPPTQPAAQPVAVAPPPARVDTTPARPVEAEPQPAEQPRPAAPVVVAPPPDDVIPTNPIPAPGEIGQIAIGQTVRGALSPGDQTMADGTYSDTWQFQGNAGQTVTIDVRSTAFSTYVQLFDSGGNRLAEDVGSGGGNNSRLVYNLKANGMYQIVVVNSEGQRVTGLYTVSIR